MNETHFTLWACEQIWKKCGFVARVEILGVGYPKQQVHSLSKRKGIQTQNLVQIYNASTYLSRGFLMDEFQIPQHTCLKKVLA
jgi:hypothetical protein